MKINIGGNGSSRNTQKHPNRKAVTILCLFMSGGLSHICLINPNVASIPWAAREVPNFVILLWLKQRHFYTHPPLNRGALSSHCANSSWCFDCMRLCEFDQIKQSWRPTTQLNTTTKFVQSRVILFTFGMTIRRKTHNVRWILRLRFMVNTSVGWEIVVANLKVFTMYLVKCLILWQSCQ